MFSNETELKILGWMVAIGLVLYVVAYWFTPEGWIGQAMK